MDANDLPRRVSSPTPPARQVYLQPSSPNLRPASGSESSFRAQAPPRTSSASLGSPHLSRPLPPISTSLSSRLSTQDLPTVERPRDNSAATTAKVPTSAAASDFLVSRSPSAEGHRLDVEKGLAVAGAASGDEKEGDEKEPLSVDMIPFEDDEDAESLVMSPSKTTGKKSLTFRGVTVARAAALKEEPEAEPFGQSVRRTLLWLLMTRMPLVIVLVLLVVLTNTQWWMGRPSDIVFMQQLLTAAVGLILGVLIREFTFMAQGALAATWVFRPHKSSIPVAEAIQFGNPALLINSAGVSFFDIGIVVMLPVLAVLFNVVYKFGITVEDNASPWSGLIRTGFLTQFMDTRTVMTESCQGVYDSCKWDIFQPNYTFSATKPSLSDYSFAPGIDYGKQTDNGLGYVLIGGDVPQIDDEFKRNVKGMAFKQVFVNSTVDCSRTVFDAPWITSCAGGVQGLTYNDTTEVRNVTVCPPVSNVLVMSITFYNTSLGLSCLVTSALSLRNVVATPDLNSWIIAHAPDTPKDADGPKIASLTPLNASTMAEMQQEMTGFGVTSVSMRVDRSDPPYVCFGTQGTGCRGLSPSFEAEVAANLAVTFAGYVFWFLHDKTDTTPYTPPAGAIGPDHREPLPGRIQFKGDGKDPWVNVWGPVGVLNLTATPGMTSIAGAYAETLLIRNQYVAVRFWLLALLVLPLMELLMAFVKFLYRSHAFEPVCGFVWTIRKINVEVAADANGLGLRQVLAYARNLKLDWKDDSEGALALSLARSARGT
ncbi:hypothetical protein HK101_009977, partial [Irineochytrium annulatum]